MSRHHNTKHPLRGVSNYPARLRRRGFSKSPELEPLETLRRRQERREAETGQPWWTASAEALEAEVA